MCTLLMLKNSKWLLFNIKFLSTDLLLFSAEAFAECLTNRDCRVLNAECVGGYCACRQGYHAIGANCSEYGILYGLIFGLGLLSEIQRMDVCIWD